jgi:hypothetical protein
MLQQSGSQPLPPWPDDPEKLLFFQEQLGKSISKGSMEEWLRQTAKANILPAHQLCL